MRDTWFENQHFLLGDPRWKIWLEKNDLRIAWNEFNQYSFVNRLRFRGTLESNTFERQIRFFGLILVTYIGIKTS